MSRSLKSTEERFWEKVYLPPCPDDCWTWIAHKVTGYGHFRANGKDGQAHRWADEDAIGPIPEGLTLDHLCRNRACVNPAHLEPVTIGENVLRGVGPTAVRARQRACHMGHPFNETNTYIGPNGYRQCRACAAARMRRYREAAVLAALEMK